MDNWDEIRTAFHVARAGTVSGAAETLGVHHATVIRHIDAIEERLGVKLFQRHARGYTPTEAGQDLLRVAQTTDEQFAQLEGRIKGQGAGVSGELVVTSLVGLSPMLAPALERFQRLYPDVVLRFLAGDRLFRLEYGEAHVAIRAGAPPEQLDNVVQRFTEQRMGLYAAQTYVAHHGLPASEAELPGHRFAAQDDANTRAPFEIWLRDRVPAQAIVFRASSSWTVREAVRCGAGIGFLPMLEAQNDPTLIEVLPSQDVWSAPLWLVTHVDLHRTSKVQAFLKHLKEEAALWDR